MDCKYFESCSAPMCPKDAGVAQTTWFPEEPICRPPDVPEWIKRQRRIARKAAPGGSFTLAMPQRDCRISRGIKGINPDGTDGERKTAEAAWLKAHPAITEEERAKWKARGEKQTALLSRLRSEKTGQHQGLVVPPGLKP